MGGALGSAPPSISRLQFVDKALQCTIWTCCIGLWGKGWI